MEKNEELIIHRVKCEGGCGEVFEVERLEAWKSPRVMCMKCWKLLNEEDA